MSQEDCHSLHTLVYFFFFFGHVKKFKLYKSSCGDRSCSSSPLQTRDAQSTPPQHAALSPCHQLGLYEVKKFHTVGREWETGNK